MAKGTSQDTDSTTLSTEPENKKETPDYWRRWIKAAQEADDFHRRATDLAWEEYTKQSFSLIESGILDNKSGKFVDPKPYPIYYSSCALVESAYYSRTPKIKSKRRHGVKDPLSLTMVLINDRLGTYLQSETDFNFTMRKAVLDFLHGDKACAAIKFDADEVEVEKRVPVMPAPAEDGSIVYVLSDGAPAPYDDEPLQDEQGFFYLETTTELQNHKLDFVPCPYDEVLHTPTAKCEAEITEKAYYFWMSRVEAEERFPDAQIHWKSGTIEKRGRASRDDERQPERVEFMGEYLEGWECWDKDNKKVYWISEQDQSGFLDQKDDLYGLKDFFPSTKFAIGSPPKKDLYPTPLYVQLLSVIERLHNTEARIHDLIIKVRRRALVDGSDENLLLALRSLEQGEFVAVKELQHILEKGGVDNCVWYIPVKELVESIRELIEFEQKFKAEFYEWFKVPDILRGVTDQYEAAKTQALKSASGQDVYKTRKELIGEIAREGLQQMVDLAYATFPDEKIAAIVGYGTLERGHQERFAMALDRLRNDDTRCVLIEIDTDSMSYLDDQLKAERTNAAVTTLIRGLEQVAQMVKVSPVHGTVGLQALLLMLENMGVSKDFEDMAKESVNTLLEQAKNPPPPPPDYEQMKIELKQQKQQVDTQIKARELQLQEMKLQIDAYRNRDIQTREAARIQIEQLRLQLQDVVERFRVELEAQRVAIQDFNAQINAREAMMEETRLAKEVDNQRFDTLVTAATAQKQEAKEETREPAVINIINQAQPQVEPQVLTVPEPIPVPVPGIIDEEIIL